MKQFTVLFYTAQNFDLAACTKPPIGETRKDLAIRHLENYFQLRNVTREKQNIYGRFCKIRMTDKPTVGSVSKSTEKIILEDVIEASYFRYARKEKVILIQQNDAVKTNIADIFIQLLCKLHGNLRNKKPDFSPVLDKESEVFKGLRRNKSLITSITFSLPSEITLDMDVGDEKSFTMDEETFRERNKLALRVGITPGQASDSTVRKCIDLFKRKKIDNAHINIRGQSAVDFLKLQKRRPVKIPANSSHEQVYQQLAEVDVNVG